MDELAHTTTDALEQAEEKILTHTFSDEALEAAARMTRRTSWNFLCTVLPPGDCKPR